MKDRRKKLEASQEPLFKILHKFFERIWSKGRNSLTIMITPHNEAKIVHFNVSLFFLWVIALLAVLMVIGVVFFSTGYAKKNLLLAKQNVNAEQLQSALDDISKEINRADHYSKIWSEAVNSASGVANSNVPKDKLETMDSEGDVSLHNADQSVSSYTNPSVERLAGLRGLMEESIPKLKNLQDKLDSQRKLLSEMPTRWPSEDVSGNQVGFISALFGANRDPFTGEWQFHTGTDIAFARGTPIVAAANGTVVKTDYQAGGYGNYVIVRHSYGFYTRYGHMQRYIVSPGDVIKQGQQIGNMGSTGRSTGPHVHFEVMIGTEVVDSMRYLSINNQAFSRYIRDNGEK